jgi:hypothetical protein
MRIGYIGHFGLWHTELGIADALEKKAEVDCYHYEGMDLDRFTARKYDLVLTTVPHMLPVDFWKAQKGLKVAHYFDLIVGWQNREAAYFPKLREFDLVLSPDGFDGSAYEKAGINRKWFAQAFDPFEHYPVEAKVTGDIGFLGHDYGRRADVFKRLAKKYDFEHAGQNDEFRGIEHPKFCASKKIMLAKNATNDIPGYWSIRVYTLLAVKSFVLHPYVEGLDRYFEDGKHLAIWRDEKDLYDKIDYYLKHPRIRQRIAEAGNQLVMERDTWDARMEEFWQLVSDLESSDTRTKPRVRVALPGSSGSISKATRSSQFHSPSKVKKSGPKGKSPQRMRPQTSQGGSRSSNQT